MIAYKQEDGSVACCTLASSVPEGTAYIECEPPASGKKFRAARDIVDGALVVDIAKAKEMLHTERRRLREELFAPEDAIMAKRLPNNQAAEDAAEARRVEIRAANAHFQTVIDACETESELMKI